MSFLFKSVQMLSSNSSCILILIANETLVYCCCWVFFFEWGWGGNGCSVGVFFTEYIHDFRDEIRLTTKPVSFSSTAIQNQFNNFKYFRKEFSPFASSLEIGTLNNIWNIFNCPFHRIIYQQKFEELQMFLYQKKGADDDLYLRSVV